MSIPIGCNLNLNNSVRGINSLDPINPQDLATKAYVDNIGVELRAYSFYACRNATINSDQALRRQNGTFISNCPYIAPFDSIISSITAQNNPSSIGGNWDLVVEVNGSVVSTVNVPGGQYKTVVNGLNVALSEGDEIVIFFRNSSGNISNPGGGIHCKEVGTAGKQSYNFLACRNATINSDQALRRQNGTFISNCPYVVPFNSIIYAATAENNPNDISETWDLDIEVNGSIVATLSIPGSDHKVVNNSLNIGVNQGDELIIYFRNASGGVNNPGGIVYLLET